MQVVRHEAFMLSASRKLLLQATSWRPVDVPEKAVLVCAHHYGQHGGRLDKLGGILAANGIALIAPDYQGWGRSESHLQYESVRMGTDVNYAIKSEEQLVADFDKFTTRVMQFYTIRKPDPRYPLTRILKEKTNPWDPEPPIAPKIPIFVLGHGLGAPVVARFVADRVEPDHEKKAGLGGMVLAAPWIGHTPVLSNLSQWRFLEELAHKYVPYTKVLGAEPDPSTLFEDLEEVVAWEQDPIVTKCALSPATVRIIQTISRQANEVLESITVPTFVMAGAADVLSPPEVSAAVVEKLGSAEKDLIMVPDSKHDLFRSSEGTAHFAMAALVDWISEKTQEFIPPPDPFVAMDEERRSELERRYA
ncbi:hypothetical protein DIPPA_28293 [Diplonema papillatum]|nr:hypothetical protein DIPPA_28293 [Diplonema papillatum]